MATQRTQPPAVDVEAPAPIQPVEPGPQEVLRLFGHNIWDFLLDISRFSPVPYRLVQWVVLFASTQEFSSPVTGLVTFIVGLMITVMTMVTVDPQSATNRRGAMEFVYFVAVFVLALFMSLPWWALAGYAVLGLMYWYHYLRLYEPKAPDSN
jgi:hypothetical protein